MAAGRTAGLLTAFVSFFGEVGDVRFVKGFLALPLDPADLAAADLEAAGLETLRVGGFEAAALFALGRAVFV